MRRPDLIADCTNCAAVCCVAPPFDRSEDFGIDKQADERCPHLTGESHCAIHLERATRGFRGCVVYECYGAGPSVTRRFPSAEGREQQRNAAFMVLRVVHELLWQLTEAAKLVPPLEDGVAAHLKRAIAELDAIAQGPVEEALAIDVASLEKMVRAALRRLGDVLGGRTHAARSLPVVQESQAECASVREVGAKRA